MQSHTDSALYIRTASATYCANSEGSYPLAAVTECSALHAAAESLSAVCLSHWKHISAFTSHSQCPLKLDQPTHYVHASTVQLITRPTQVRSSHSLWPLQYGPATHYTHSSTVQPLTMPIPVQSSHSLWPFQYGQISHYAHSSTVQPIIRPTPVQSSHSIWPICPPSAIFLMYLSRCLLQWIPAQSLLKTWHSSS